MIRVIVGPPCAGKTTYVAERMADGDVRVDYDQLLQALGTREPYAEVLSESQLSAASAARRSVVGRVLDTEAPLGDDVWLIYQDVPQALVDRLEAVGAEFIELDPGREECERRATEQGRPQRTFDGIAQWYARRDADTEAEAEAGDDSNDDKKAGGAVFTKAATASVKTVTKDKTADQGIVTMLVSVFGKVDTYGDEVQPGAFTDSLAAWKESGDPIPFVWAHKWADPEAHIGVITEAKETDSGLEVTAALDLDRPFAEQVFHLLKARRITQASFAYDVIDHEWVEREAPDGAKYEVLELRKLDLLEAGPCFLGVNRETELIEAKARLAKARDILGPAACTSEKTSGDEPGQRSAQTRARLILTTLEGSK